MANRRKGIVPKDSRYIPFSQQPYCCVPTSIQMVMYRHNIPLISAEELGYHLGLVVPKDAAGFFWNPRVGKKPPISGYGTQIYEKKFEPNRVFKKLKIPLRMDIKRVDSFKDLSAFKKYLADLSKKDFDVLACFNHATLTGEPEKDWGHVCVVDRMYPNKNLVRLIDPARSPKWRIVTMKKLYEAMKAHRSQKTAGFWELYLTKDF